MWGTPKTEMEKGISRIERMKAEKIKISAKRPIFRSSALLHRFKLLFHFYFLRFWNGSFSLLPSGGFCGPFEKVTGNEPFFGPRSTKGFNAFLSCQDGLALFHLLLLFQMARAFFTSRLHCTSQHVVIVFFFNLFHFFSFLSSSRYCIF